MSETEKVDVSTDLLEQQKAKAVEYLRMLGIFILTYRSVIVKLKSCIFQKFFLE